MAIAPRPASRRERNKQEKLQRITAAASKLFATHGVDEVTTHQIAKEADIGTGTLFLYAKSKGELLLLAQNAHYSDALAEGMAASEKAATPLDAVMALLVPIIKCNRKQIENGCTYLREMVFGDPTEPQHVEALRIVQQTEEQLAKLLGDDEPAGTLAHVISAIMFLEMASAARLPTSTEAVIARVRNQVQAILPK